MILKCRVESVILQRVRSGVFLKDVTAGKDSFGSGEPRFGCITISPQSGESCAMKDIAEKP